MSETLIQSSNESFSVGEDYRLNITLSGIKVNNEVVSFQQAGRSVTYTLSTLDGAILAEGAMTTNDGNIWHLLIPPAQTAQFDIKAATYANVIITLRAPDLDVTRFFTHKVLINPAPGGI